MAQNFMPLFCGVLGVLCQSVVSNEAGYCQSNTPAVRLCNDDLGSAPTVFVDTHFMPPFDNRTCRCTLEIGNGNQKADIKVSRLRRNDSNIDMFIDNNKVLVSSDLKTFSDIYGMALKFENSGSQYKEQCYKFSIVSSNPAGKDITISCDKVESTETTTTITQSSTDSTIDGSHTSDTDETTKETTTTITQSSTDSTKDGSQTSDTDETTKGTVDTSSNGSGKSNTSKESMKRTTSKKINIGIIAGAAGGAFVVVVVVVIITIVICKRRRASDKGKKQNEPDKHEEPEYSLTTNAGYVSADDCQREADHATEHDPRGYTLVNKPRTKQRPTQQNAVDEDNYNHLNNVLYTHNPANVYNARAEATAESDIDDYNRLNEFRKPNETDNVYNVTSSNTNPSNEYDRTNVPTRNGPADYEYSTTNKVYKP